MARRKLTKSVPKIVKKTLNTALTNKFVLYFVCFLAVFNVFGYLNLQNYDAVIFFILVAVLTKCFTKNMIIILLTAMIGTSILNSARNKRYGVIEGLTIEGAEGQDEEKKPHLQAGQEGAPRPPQGTSPKEAQPSVAGTGGDTEDDMIDVEKTGDAGYGRAQNALTPDKMKHLSEETAALRNQQKNLAETMQALQPMVVQANSMMDSLDTTKISNLLDVFNKFKGVGGGKASPHSPGANSFKTV